MSAVWAETASVVGELSANMDRFMSVRTENDYVNRGMKGNEMWT